MPYSRSLLRASFEVILRPSSIWLLQKDIFFEGSNPGPTGRESSAISARPGSYRNRKTNLRMFIVLAPGRPLVGSNGHLDSTFLPTQVMQASVGKGHLRKYVCLKYSYFLIIDFESLGSNH